MSIKALAKCDFIINCDNGEDEKNCTDDRFYCESGDTLFVKRSQVNKYTVIYGLCTNFTFFVKGV